jgi:NTP pyrophosphatase (non-canonical NTP hydrolase)
MKHFNEYDLGIKELISICTKRAEDKGWHDKPITFSEACALMHSEISEAYEEYRNGHEFNEIYNQLEFTDEPLKPEGIPIELADLAIRLFHYCGYYHIDLAEAISTKLDYNLTRPYRHGNKKS